MNAYSMDLRQRVVAACDRGEETRDQVARRFGVSIAWVYKLLRRRREADTIAPKPHGGGQPPAFDAEADGRLCRAVADRPDATLEDLRQAAGIDCGISAVHRAVERLGLPRKKSRSGPPSRTGRS
jgi:transposase